MEEIAQDLYDYMAHLSEKCLFKSIFTIFHKPREQAGITGAGKAVAVSIQPPPGREMRLCPWKGAEKPLN